MTEIIIFTNCETKSKRLELVNFTLLNRRGIIMTVVGSISGNISLLILQV